MRRGEPLGKRPSQVITIAQIKYPLKGIFTMPRMLFAVGVMDVTKDKSLSLLESPGKT
jgi:hypothetical protein